MLGKIYTNTPKIKKPTYTLLDTMQDCAGCQEKQFASRGAKVETFYVIVN